LFVAPAFADDADWVCGAFVLNEFYGFNFQTAHSHGHRFAISPQISREFCFEILPLKFRGRRECRALDAPAASRAK
jgi:hypothetical protein